MKKLIFILGFIGQICMANPTTSPAQYNKENNSKLQTLTQHAKNVDLNSIPSHFRFSMCGPVTLFPSLKAVHKLPKEETLLNFTNTLHNYGDFSNFTNGMSAQQLQDALDAFSIKSIQHKYYDIDYAVENIIEDLEKNNLVYVIVPGNVSYSVLTHIPMEDNIGYHWVQIVSLNKDSSGKVSKFAVYDINAFIQNKKTINYIDVSELNTILNPSIYEGLGSRFGVYVSTKDLTI